MAKLTPTPETDLAAISGLETEALRLRWAELYGAAPSPRISRDLLIRGVAYRVQEEVLGALDKSSRRQLQRLAIALRDGGSMPGVRDQSFKPGTRLIREWKGQVHEVVIAGDIYLWGGKSYRSLSQIARAITGTRWSGPRFFGLEAGHGTGRQVKQSAAAAQLAPSQSGSIDG